MDRQSAHGGGMLGLTSTPRRQIRPLGAPDHLDSSDLIVQKYCGSSIADVDGIKRVAQRIHDSRAAGRRVVAVISAMGDITDELLELAAKVSPSPAARDLDFSAHHRRASIALLVWLWRTSVSRRSCSPGTVRVETDDVHGKAHIVDVDPRRLPTVLARGEIPLVAGFQGKKLKSKETTTPGRRGSDLTGNAN